MFLVETEKRKITEKYGLRMVPVDDDPYEFNLGKPVKIHTQNVTLWGIYSGITRNDDLVLWPFVETNDVYFLDLGDAKDMETVRKFVWEDSRPNLVKSYVVHGISPRDKDYIDECIKSLNGIADSRISMLEKKLKQVTNA